MQTRTIFAAGLVAVAIAVVITLSSAPVIVFHTNSVAAAETFAETKQEAGVCQANEVLPAGTSMIRLSLTSDAGSRVEVTALLGERVLTSGSVGSGWIGGSVAIPVRRVARTTLHTRICIEIAPTKETVGIVGERTSAAVAARAREGTAMPGRFKVEYLRDGSKSWWSMALVIARRMGLGRAPSGTWIVLLLFVLMVAVVAGASWVTIKELP